MTKTEKIIVAILTILLGVLLIAFQETVLKIAVALVGFLLIALALLDFFHKSYPLAIVKLVAGVVVILFGVFAVKAVVYILAGLLLVFGLLLLYERFRTRVYCASLWQKIIAYLLPAICVSTGILLLFGGGKTAEWVFIVSGVLIIVEGGILLADVFISD